MRESEGVGWHFFKQRKPGNEVSGLIQHRGAGLTSQAVDPTNETTSGLVFFLRPLENKYRFERAISPTLVSIVKLMTASVTIVCKTNL